MVLIYRAALGCKVSYDVIPLTNDAEHIVIYIQIPLTLTGLRSA